MFSNVSDSLFSLGFVNKPKPGVQPRLAPKMFVVWVTMSMLPVCVSGQLAGQVEPPTPAGSGSGSVVVESPVGGQQSFMQLQSDQSRITDQRSIARNPMSAKASKSEEIDQINEIRRQMGGGVAAQLEGLFDDTDEGHRQLQQEFDQRLNELVGTSSSGLQTPACPSNPVSVDNAAVLRLSARKLDSVAADLEDLQLYAEADQIRANAKMLRSRARAIAPQQATHTGLAPVPVAGQIAPDAVPLTTSKQLGLPMNSPDSKIPPRQGAR